MMWHRPSNTCTIGTLSIVIWYVLQYMHACIRRHGRRFCADVRYGRTNLLVLWSSTLFSLYHPYLLQKPDNIGFDESGTLKLFDFGLAKELCEDQRDENGLYRMTGFTGAIRYMAPEVGLYQPYNEKADVYSWSMLFWYILALEPPMGAYTYNMIINRVFQKGYRPTTDERWPDGLRNLMRAAWAHHSDRRPSFTQVIATLKEEVGKMDEQIASFMGAD